MEPNIESIQSVNEWLSSTRNHMWRDRDYYIPKGGKRVGFQTTDDYCGDSHCVDQTYTQIVCQTIDTKKIIAFHIYIYICNTIYESKCNTIFSNQRFYYEKQVLSILNIENDLVQFTCYRSIIFLLFSST